jgi:hypothetical protein
MSEIDALPAALAERYRVDRKLAPPEVALNI